MAKIQIEGFILRGKEDYQKDYFTFHNREMLDSYLTVCPHTIEFEMPENFDPVLAEIDGLNKQKTAFLALIEAINDRISNLQCLEFNPTPAPADEVAGEDDFPF